MLKLSEILKKIDLNNVSEIHYSCKNYHHKDQMVVNELMITLNKNKSVISKWSFFFDKIVFIDKEKKYVNILFELLDSKVGIIKPEFSQRNFNRRRFRLIPRLEESSLIEFTIIPNSKKTKKILRKTYNEFYMYSHGYFNDKNSISFKSIEHLFKSEA